MSRQYKLCGRLYYVFAVISLENIIFKYPYSVVYTPLAPRGVKYRDPQATRFQPERCLSRCCGRFRLRGRRWSCVLLVVPLPQVGLTRFASSSRTVCAFGFAHAAAVIVSGRRHGSGLPLALLPLLQQQRATRHADQRREWRS